ncbi:S-layer family protein [Brevifollis gellanilyticus]|uniref:Uncharacterized protein n=1 Tax=Brevifollis gellanilyticus TaxID=748831 RepID=A0A512M5D1_9BACT|nr:S-layer family protein [Brevifollis gellanilyticus]GEP41926.1 hypothetical protein BGE01nite_12170 [Brevifollis gellanilyticus]
MQTLIFVVTPEMSEVLQRYMPEETPEAPRLKDEALLHKMGIPFPEGAEVIKHGRTANQLIVRNTPENLALIQQLVDALKSEAEGGEKANTLAPMIDKLHHPDAGSTNGPSLVFMLLITSAMLVIGLGVVWLLLKQRSDKTKLKASGSMAMLAILSALMLTPAVASAAEAVPAQPDPAPHTVIVPYDATKLPAEQKAQRLYLPYESFQKLWQQAKENRRPEVVPADEHAFEILSALHEVRVEDRGLVIESKIEAVLRGHWTRLPLPYMSGKTALLVGEVQVDGKAAALNDGAVVLEDPGVHQIHLTATLALERDWKKAELQVPPAVGALLAVHTPKSDGWLRINGQFASAVEEKDAGRVFTTGISAQNQLVLERSARGLDRGEGPVTSARVSATLTLREHQREALETRIVYEFPGSTRRRVSFTIDTAEQELSTVNAELQREAVPVESMAVRQEGTLRLHEVTFAREVTDQVELVLSTLGKKPGQAVIAPQAEAQRVQEVLSILHDETMELKAQPTATQRRVQATAVEGLTAMAYEQSAHAPLAITVTQRAQLTRATVDYVFQLSPQKIELIAALSLQRRIGKWNHLRVTLPPGGYEVQGVTGPALLGWQHEGADLFLHLTPDVAQMDARLVVHLARTVAQPAVSWTLEPLGLTGFEKVTGRVLVTAHAASEVRLPALSPGLKEVDATVLDSVIAIAPPIEKKRALEFEDHAWKLAVPLTPQVARFVAEGVALVLVSDAGVRLSQQIGVQVTQGALRQATVRLPASLPEAVVTGPQLRELRSRVEGAVRIYDCTFQSDVLDRAELTFDHDLPLGATLDVPFANVDAAERITRYFVTDNVSAREASVAEKTGIESVSKEAMPYLPADLARPQFYRSTGAGTLKLAFQQLTATEANAALVTLADITTVLRADGERWDTIQYSLLNRTLQFLPVKLSGSSELMSASVNGEPVRADEEKRADGVVKLIPLIQTKPGHRALEVRLVCRVKSSGDVPAKAPKLDDPELPGLSVERTTWSVWTPKGMVVHDFDGNMEEVDEEGRDLQKLEGMLSELGDVNRELASGKLSYDDAKDAYSRANRLADQVSRAKEAVINRASKFGSALLGKDRYEKKPSASRKDYAEDEMDQEVTKQRDLLDKNWSGYVGKTSKSEPSAKPTLKPKTDWNANYAIKGDEGTLKFNNTFTGNTIVANGGAVLNDNVIVSNGFFGNGTAQQSIAGNGGFVANNAQSSLVQNGSNTIALGNARANNLSSPRYVDMNEPALGVGNKGEKKSQREMQQGTLSGTGAVSSAGSTATLGGIAVPVPPEGLQHLRNEKRRILAEEFPKAAPAPAPATSPAAGVAPMEGFAYNGAAMSSSGRLQVVPPPPPGVINVDPFGSAPAPALAPAAAADPFAAPALRSPSLPDAPASELASRTRARADSALDKSSLSEDDMRRLQAQTAEFLRPTGRRSLLVEIPEDGEVRHFTKLKDHAVLDLDLRRTWKPGTASHLIWLAFALAAWAVSMRWKRVA